MLNFFSEGELPGGAEGPFASRDLTSFYEIWQAAQRIGNTCVVQYGRPGWAAQGMLPSVIVLRSSVKGSGMTGVGIDD